MYKIIVYYDIKQQSEYIQFLYQSLIRHYLENTDFKLINTKNDYQGRKTILLSNNNNQIKIITTPLALSAVRGQVADMIYIQNQALWKTNSEVLSYLPMMFKNASPQIYIYDEQGVTGKWNTD